MKIPYHIKQEALWIVRGYEVRKRIYAQMRADILNQSVSGAGDGTPHAHNAESQVEQKALQLEKLEKYPEVRKMRAVEYAERQIGQDVLNEETRNRLREAIIQNCKSGRRYPFEHLGIDEFSRRDFYRRKDKFLSDVADYMDKKTS